MDMVPTDYVIAQAITPEALQAEVKALIEAGWFPHGGVEVYKDGLRATWAQAMVKWKDKA